MPQAARSAFHAVQTVRASQVEHGAGAMKSLSQQTDDRQENAGLIYRAFRAPSQAEIAEATARYLARSAGRDVSTRTVINWLQCKHDMPAWAYKAVARYIDGVDRLARRIEG